MSIHFGDFSVDESRRQLLRSGQPVHLSPKAFQLLSILAHQSPGAVSKADIQELLWPGTFVTEGSLTTLIKELRSALGDDAREPRFIRTLYGFGYSFAAPVEELEPSVASQHKRRFGHLTSAAAFGAVAAILILATRSSTGYSRPTSSPTIRTIAVLPFDTSGADRSDQHLGLGLPDLLITRLTNVRQIVVRPTSAVREFADQKNDFEAIGRKLKVDAVVEGSIRTSPDRVRVTVQLLDVRDNKPIWADRFDEKRADLFTIEDSVSGKLAEALRLQLTPDEKHLLGKRYTSDPEAYQLYVQGRYHQQQVWAGRFYPDEAVRALEFFQKSVRKDPRFAEAWSGLARSYLACAGFRRLPVQQARIDAQNAANTALALDGSLSESYTVLGELRVGDLDFYGAQRLCERGLEVNPRDLYTLYKAAFLLQALGHFDQAIALSKRIVEIDPISANNQWRLGNVYLTSGQYDLAAKQVQIVLGMDPNYYEARIAQVRLAMARGDYDAAIAESRKLAEPPENTKALAFLGYALARAGRRGEAQDVLRQLIERSASGNDALYFEQAVIQAGLGNVDAMTTLLEQGVEDRTYTLRLKTEPVFLPYHSNPRFAALLRRAGFKD